MATRAIVLTPWLGSPGLVETVASGPPTGVLGAVAQASSFSGAGTVPASLTGVMGAAAQPATFAGVGSNIAGTLGAVAQAASFAGVGTVGTSNNVLMSDSSNMLMSDGSPMLFNTL